MYRKKGEARPAPEYRSAGEKGQLASGHQIALSIGENVTAKKAVYMQLSGVIINPGINTFKNSAGNGARFTP